MKKVIPSYLLRYTILSVLKEEQDSSGKDVTAGVLKRISISPKYLNKSLFFLSSTGYIDSKRCSKLKQRNVYSMTDKGINFIKLFKEFEDEASTFKNRKE